VAQPQPHRQWRDAGRDRSIQIARVAVTKIGIRMELSRIACNADGGICATRAMLASVCSTTRLMAAGSSSTTKAGCVTSTTGSSSPSSVHA
jgi:hypothetical protein